MVKRSLSVLLTVLMTLSLIMVPAMGVSANVEKVDIADYTPVMPDSVAIGTIYGTGTSGITLTGVASGIWNVAAGATNTPPTDYATPMGGGYWIPPCAEFTMDTNYVISFNVRNKSTEGIDANVVYGLFDGAQGGEAAGWGWKGQYAWAEEVSSADWTKVSRTFTLAYNATGTEAKSNLRFKIGLGTGNTFSQFAGKDNFDFRPGAAFDMDINTIYIAKEVAYDVENELSMTKVLPGTTVVGNAKVVNQVGDKSELDQNMTYFVTDTEGNLVEGVSVVADSNGSYKVNVAETAQDGDYVITARSSAYSNETILMQTPVVLTVEAVDYSDASVAVSPETLGAMTKLTDYNGVAYDMGVSLTETGNYYTFTAKDSQVTVPAGIARPAGGVEWKYNNGDKGEKLILTFKVKKNNDSDVVPNLMYGLGDASMGGSAQNYAWKTQTYYSFDVTSTEWQTVTKEIVLPCDTTSSTVVTLGLGAGCTHNEWIKRTDDEFRAGGSVVVDMDSFKLYKDGVAKVSNEALTATSVFAGQTIEAKAEVVNAAGIKGNLDQTLEYIVLDSATRKKQAADISITTGADGAYTINVGENAQEGNYVAVMSNTTNGTVLRTGLEFTVETIDKYVVDSDVNATSCIAWGNIGNGRGAGVEVISDATTNWNYRATAADSRADSDIPSGVTKPAAGLIWNIPTGNISAGDTYVLSFKVKNLSPDGITPNVVFGVVDGSMGGPAQNYAWKGQYTWVEEVTEKDDWTTITKRITFDLNGTSSTQLVVGLGTGNTHDAYKNKEDFDFRPGAVIDIQLSSAYLAPEAVYDVDVEASKELVRAGATIEVDATVVNQIGQAGDLSQDFSWAALNATKTAIAQDITVAPVEADTSKVNVTFGRDVEEGDYVIAAYSKDYEMTKSVTITVSNKTTVENIALDIENKTVTFDTLNVCDGGLVVNVYIAEYTENGTKLEKAEAVPVLLSEGNNIGAQAIFTKDFNVENDIRIFVWTTDLAPITQKKDI